MDDEISVEELKALIDEGEAVRLVDIRSRAAFERGHIPSSENIPFAELPRRVEELDGADRVVTICPMGESSIQAARLIKSYEGAGEARVESLREGLQGWEYGFESGAGGEQAEADGGSEGPDAPF
ncbi:rhodanese-like domain-containing protein [Halomarina litorea]|uniref:rhodanese-like domain-containing protein n=1 Tax=Halomarina litorea TaxID=2961595 RepID=UPI0020C5025B|nr:rhodanese-like domain-containing protein [Halomarina sp. BCD28]